MYVRVRQGTLLGRVHGNEGTIGILLPSKVVEDVCVGVVKHLPVCLWVGKEHFPGAHTVPQVRQHVLLGRCFLLVRSQVVGVNIIRLVGLELLPLQSFSPLKLRALRGSRRQVLLQEQRKRARLIEKECALGLPHLE